MTRMDPFMRRMLAIGIVVVAGSVGASMGLTAWLTTDMDAASRAYGLLISATIPGLVAPVAVSTIAWMAVRNHRLLLEVDRLANHDELTGLLNRRAFLSRGGAWLAERAEGRTVVALADLDHFKRVNDQLGHAAGDAALRHVAMRLRETAPEGSLLARLGGEEFVLLCDWAGLSETQAAMERVRDGIAASPCPVADGVDVAVTVSIGIAIATPGDSMDALLRRADAAMYAAKHGGRNQTRVAA